MNEASPKPHSRGGECGRLNPRAIMLVLLLFAVFSCTTTTANVASDPAAKTTAESFVRSWLRDNWETALTYVAESGPDRESLSVDHEFFRTHDFRVVGPARFTNRIGSIDVPGYVVRPSTPIEVQTTAF
jgi:hypothetical protein